MGQYLPPLPFGMVHPELPAGDRQDLGSTMLVDPMLILAGDYLAQDPGCLVGRLEGTKTEVFGTRKNSSMDSKSKASTDNTRLEERNWL